jgi:hypothetical protein
MKDSLFGHLAFQFSSSTENTATEALCYILNKSHTVRKVLCDLVVLGGVSIDENLSFETQVLDDDQAIPDLVGVNPGSNVPEIIVEVKFWAGLTGNQPVTYLNRGKQKSGNLILFLCPQKRIHTLTYELERRCKEANILEDSKNNIDDGLFVINLQEHPRLEVISWEFLLSRIRKVVEAEGNISTLADIIELQGLAARVNETAFIPIESDEITGNVASRILQYCDLVDGITKLLHTKKIASLKGYKSTSTRGQYGRYMSIENHGCMIQFNSTFWRDLYPTPLWMSMQWTASKSRWVFPTETKKALSYLENENPSRLYSTKSLLLLPLFLPVKSEFEACIDSVYQQLCPIISAMGDIYKNSQI